ncbi:MAG TPA: hypothetical protein DCP63_15795 [Bacteroidetes bacterium]|nr:hypothetical protein [Bacteroidota bacterium]
MSCRSGRKCGVHLDACPENDELDFLFVEPFNVELKLLLCPGKQFDFLLFSFVCIIIFEINDCEIVSQERLDVNRSFRTLIHGN